MRQQAVLARANRLDADGLSREATRLLGKEIDAGRADPELLRKFAYILMRDGRELEFRQRFASAKAKWRKDSYLLGRYAAACFILDDLDEALAAYRELLPLLPVDKREWVERDLRAVKAEIQLIERTRESLSRARWGIAGGLALTAFVVAGVWIIARRRKIGE